jgi:hypothetical protein
MNAAWKGAAIAAGVAALLGTTGCGEEDATAEAGQALVKCEGINECKGQSDCAGATNDCAGLNECAGTGYLEVTEDECAAKGGKVIEEG